MNRRVGEQLTHGFQPPRRFGHDEHPGDVASSIDASRGRCIEQAAQSTDRIGHPTLHGQVGQGEREVGFRGFTRVTHPHARKGLGCTKKIVRFEEQFFRAEYRPLDIARQESVALLGIDQEVGRGWFHLAMHDHRRSGGQVIEQRGRGLMEQGKPVLDTGGQDAVADIAIHGRTTRIAFESFTPSATECIARRLVCRHFACRQKTHRFHRIQRALRIRIKGLDRLQIVAEQIEAVRQGRTHGEQVDESATDCILPGLDDLGDMFVAGTGQLGTQGGFVQRRAAVETEGIGGQEGRRRQPVQRRGGRGDQHVDLAELQRMKRSQPFADQILMRRNRIVGQGFPVGQVNDPGTWRKVGDLVGQSLAVRRAGCQHRHAAWPVCTREQAGQLQRIGGTMIAWQWQGCADGGPMIDAARRHR